MKDLHQIQNEITELTTRIETNYPELYRSLDENPITLSVSEYPQINKKVMEDYLQTLKDILKHYLEELKIINSSI
ncbi:hypothetical protein [Lutibacter citreus]|uniref:hypothetical protein n=1 Tax=Lutibacter citreus TaxID=2138210 RepID=UPI000DBE837F|nr:hypothetical protein [Lutibacter citreus]